MFAVIEVPHGDLGPVLDSETEAFEALARIRAEFPEQGDDYGVVALDERGVPTGEVLALQESH